MAKSQPLLKSSSQLAAIVQRIERGPPKTQMQVRFLLGAPKILGPVRKVVVGQKMVDLSGLQGAKHSNTRRYCEHLQRRRPLQQAV
jgi:hypothetical protein